MIRSPAQRLMITTTRWIGKCSTGTCSLVTTTTRRRCSSRLPRRSPAALFSTRFSSTSGGYQSLGSFHSENLGELMAQTPEEYIPPSLPFEEIIEAQSDDALSSSRSSPYMLDLDRWTFLNHGAFGAALRVGFQRAQAWQRYLERQPLRYFDRDLLPHLAYSTRLLAEEVQAPHRTGVALLPHVTSGLNAVLAGYVRHYAATQSHHILLWDTTYGSVKKMARHYAGPDAVTEISLLQEPYLSRRADPRSDPFSVFQEALEDTWRQNESRLQGKQPLLILDQTASNTALNFPVTLLAQQAKERNPDTIVLVDGAHGLLAHDVQLNDPAWVNYVDFYLTNGHKWFSAPRGVALLVALSPEKWMDTILRQPAVISHGVDEPDLLSRFVWDGCRDYSAALAVPAVTDYWRNRRVVHGEDVRASNRTLLGQGIQVLADQWHPDFSERQAWPGHVTFANWEAFLHSPMALVKLPGQQNKSTHFTSNHAKRVQDALHQAQIEVPIKCVGSLLYVRLSCHEYNRIEDFQVLATTLPRVANLSGRY